MEKFVKLSDWIRKEQKKALTKKAKAEGISRSELLRQILDKAGY